MEDRKNHNILVYKAKNGQVFHYNPQCRYLNHSIPEKIRINEARKTLTVCSACRKKGTNNINPSINNNYNLNLIQNSNNNEPQNFGFKKFKSENIAFNNIHDNFLSNIIEEEEDKQIENSKYTISTINYEFSDILSISNSFAKAIKKSFQPEEKKNFLNYNNINNLINQNQIGISNIKNNNAIEINNINNINNENNNENNISLTKILIKNKIMLKGEEEKKEDVFSNKVEDKNNMIINENKNNQISLLIKKIIKNNRFQFNNKKNNFSDNINKINNKSKSKSETKFKSIHINSINHRSQKNLISKYSKNSDFNSFSIFNIKTINKNNTINLEENNIINNINNANENGNYDFSLKIIPKKKNDININIELGFEIEIFFEENNSDINLNEESSEFSEDIMFSNYTSHKIIITKNLKNLTKENEINVLIDIVKGKLFFIKKDDNKNKIFEKNNILSVSNCQKISLDKIKEVHPYLKFNSNDLSIVDMVFNGKPFYI